MRLRSVSTLFVVTFTLALAGSSSAKGMFSAGDFDVFSVDDQGGGWVINHIPARGDMLWGCADVASVKECRPVPLPDFVPGTALKFFHVDNSTQAGWLNVSVPIAGDFLMACFDPEGSPYCEKVPMELRPPLATYKREWPGYDNASNAAAGGGGGPMAMMGGGAPEVPPEGVIEPGSKGDMWMSAGIKIPGPLNLYACRDLNGNPECQLAIPDWFLIDRENVGFKKVEEVLLRDEGDPVGISIVELEEGSAAEASDLRPGDVIVQVAGFPIKNDKHFKGLLMQFPATYKIPVELENGDRVKIKVRRKPPKE